MKKEETHFDWRSFSQQTWVIIAAGLLIPPLGIALAWLKPGWSRRKRLIATALMSVVFAGWFEKKPPPNNDIASSSSTVATVLDKGVAVPAIARPAPAEASVAAAATQSNAVSQAAAPSARPSEQKAEWQPKPLPDLKSRVRRGFFESQTAYRDRIFDRTTISVLEQRYKMALTPGKWSVVSLPDAHDGPTEYESVVTGADGTRINIRLKEKDYQFVWAAYEGLSGHENTVGFWKRDGTPLSRHEFLASLAPSRTVPSLSRHWGEKMPAHIERVISTTLTVHEGQVTTVTLKESKETDTRLRYSGEAVFDNGQRLQLAVKREGNDFGWVSSRDSSWATTDGPRFWTSKGIEISGDDFCKRWMDGQTLLDVRSAWNHSRERTGQQNLERFRKAYKELNNK